MAQTSAVICFGESAGTEFPIETLYDGPRLSLEVTSRSSPRPGCERSPKALPGIRWCSFSGAGITWEKPATRPHFLPERYAQEGGDMILTQHYLACLSHASYLIGDETTGRAVVVDPRRDVGVYLQEAAERGLRIERVIETHIHADFVSGHLELADRTGAVISYGVGADVGSPSILCTTGSAYPWAR